MADGSEVAMAIWKAIRAAFVEDPDSSGLTLQRKSEESTLLLWASSDERDWYVRYSRRIAHTREFIGVLVLGEPRFLPSPSWRSERRLWWASIFAAAAAVILVYSLFPYVSARAAFRVHRKREKLWRSEIAQYDLTRSDDLPLIKLFDVNRKQLDAYQELARRQQREAFIAALASSVAGLTVLVTGARLFAGRAQQVTSTCRRIDRHRFSLSGFITATFYVLSSRATSQLNLFYDEPRTTGQLLLAERLVAHYRLHKETTFGHMIDELLERMAVTSNGVSDGPKPDARNEPPSATSQAATQPDPVRQETD